MTRVENKATLKALVETNDVFFALINDWNKYHLSYKQEYRILVLNEKRQLIKTLQTNSSELTDIQKIIEDVKRAKLRNIIIAENSILGNVMPSKRQKQKAEEIKEFGKQNGVVILDQLIVTQDSYYSYNL
ncbi:MAG: hypothetical protein BGO09_09795 [Bacteroidetes bacterium 47-18]|nr:MAG: hypothetical protein BGO09_09795 [Bacteroidetes bacterium 47-18]